MNYRYKTFIVLLIVLLFSSACTTSTTTTDQTSASKSSPTPRTKSASSPTVENSNLATPQTGSASGVSGTDPYADDGSAASGVPTSGLAPATGPENMAFFQDSLATADMFVLNLSNVDPAPAGQTYQGWLRNEDGSLASVGLLNPQADGTLHLTWSATDGKNLAASVVGIQITLEAAGGVEQPTGKIVYAGALLPEQVSLLRNLFVSNTGQPATPRNKAFAVALVQQMNLVLAHADNALNAEAIGAARERSSHLEHFINIIEGSKGERFKDYDGNGSTQNPGDGFGVLAYAQQIQEKLANPEINSLVEQVSSALVNLEQQAIAILESQPGAPLIKDLRQATEDVQLSLVITLYSLAEQAVAFPVVPVP